MSIAWLLSLTVLLAACGEIMNQPDGNQQAVVSQQADAIYRTGPETLIARSPTILAGPVSRYARRVDSYSEGGVDRIPLKWTVTGMIEGVRVLKGAAPSGPVEFSRPEQSPLVPRNPAIAHWERVYGDLTVDSQAVVFPGPAAGSILKVLPSGEGEQDLISLVRDVVAIQAVGDTTQRIKQWLAYLRSSGSDEGRKAALRSSIADGAQWAHLEPVLNEALANHLLSREVRAFAFGIVAFSVTQDKWLATEEQPLRLLCQAFAGERDPELAMQYLLSLGLIFNYSDAGSFRNQRLHVREALEPCLERRPSLAAGTDSTADAAMEQQYQALRARYLRK